jgi:hypothetical protein
LQIHFNVNTTIGKPYYCAATQYNSATGKWELDVSGLGSEFPERFLQLQNTSSLTNFGNVTYDTLKEWMWEGWQKYEDTLHTTWPDLTPFQAAGGKVLHFTVNQTTVSHRLLGTLPRVRPPNHVPQYVVQRKHRGARRLVSSIPCTWGSALRA